MAPRHVVDAMSFQNLKELLVNSRRLEQIVYKRYMYRGSPLFHLPHPLILMAILLLPFFSFYAQITVILLKG